jgi:hypothetical protein
VIYSQLQIISNFPGVCSVLFPFRLILWYFLPLAAATFTNHELLMQVEEKKRRKLLLGGKNTDDELLTRLSV